MGIAFFETDFSTGRMRMAKGDVYPGERLVTL
jgi:hypothetical protein